MPGASGKLAAGPSGGLSCALAPVTFDAKRTQVAQSAYNFAQYFTGSFEGARFGRSVARRPEIAVPEGMSTAGGKQARQSIVLSAERPGIPALTVGWVEISSRRAQLRSHRALAAVHRARFKDRLLDIDEESYNSFLGQVHELLVACGVGVTIDDDTSAVSTRPPSPREEPAPAPNVLNYVAVGFVAFVVGAFVGGAAVYARFVGF